MALTSSALEKSKHSTDVEQQGKDIHCGQRSMDSRATDLDGHERVENADGGFEGDEVAILVGEDAELSGLNAKADASRDVLFGGLEPCVPLRCKICQNRARSRQRNCSDLLARNSQCKTAS